MAIYLCFSDLKNKRRNIHHSVLKIEKDASVDWISLFHIKFTVSRGVFQWKEGIYLALIHTKRSVRTTLSWLEVVSASNIPYNLLRPWLFCSELTVYGLCFIHFLFGKSRGRIPNGVVHVSIADAPSLFHDACGNLTGNLLLQVTDIKKCAPSTQNSGFLHCVLR